MFPKYSVFFIFVLFSFLFVGCDNPFMDDPKDTETVYVDVEVEVPVYPRFANIYFMVDDKAVYRNWGEQGYGDIRVYSITDDEETTLVDIDPDANETAHCRAMADNYVVIEIQSHDGSIWQTDMVITDLEGATVFEAVDANKDESFICTVEGGKVLFHERDHSSSITKVLLWDHSSGATNLFPGAEQADPDAVSDSAVIVYTVDPSGTDYEAYSVDRATGAATLVVDLETVPGSTWFYDTDSTEVVACRMDTRALKFFPGDKTFTPAYHFCDYYIEQVSPDAAQVIIGENWYPTISEYPDRFVPYGTTDLDAVIVVGSNATVAEVQAATDIATYLTNEGYTVGAIELDTNFDTESYLYMNVITVGHPANNDLSSALLGNETTLPVGFDSGIAASNFNGYAQLIVTGASDDEVRRAANVLCDPTSFELWHSRVTVQGTGTTPSGTTQYTDVFSEPADTNCLDAYYFFDVSAETYARLDFSYRTDFKEIVNWHPKLYREYETAFGTSAVMLPGNGDSTVSDLLFYDLGTETVTDALSEMFPGSYIDDIDVDVNYCGRALIEMEVEDFDSDVIVYFDGDTLSHLYPSADYVSIRSRSSEQRYVVISKENYNGSYESSLICYDMETSTQDVIVTDNEDWVNGHGFSPDGTKYVYSIHESDAPYRRIVNIYDAATGDSLVDVVRLSSDYDIEYVTDDNWLVLERWNPERRYVLDLDNPLITDPDDPNFGEPDIRFLCYD